MCVCACVYAPPRGVLWCAGWQFPQWRHRAAQLAGTMGKALGYHIRPNRDGRGFNTKGVRWSEPVTQAMLLVNSTNESAPANSERRRLSAPPTTSTCPPDAVLRGSHSKAVGGTGCTAACAAVPQNVKDFWATQRDWGAADMYAYCEATRNGTATPLQRRICGSVRGGGARCNENDCCLDGSQPTNLSTTFAWSLGRSNRRCRGCTISQPSTYRQVDQSS